MLGYSASDYASLPHYGRNDRNAAIPDDGSQSGSELLVQVVSRYPVDLRRTLTRLRQDGASVSLVFNPAEALARASVISPDLVILDAGKDVLCAAETCRQFRMDPTLSVHPVLVLLCPSRKTYRRDLLSVGASDCLAVGDDPEEVSLRITSLVGFFLPRQSTRHARPDGLDTVPAPSAREWAGRSAVVQAICTFLVSNMSRQVTIQDVESKLGLTARQLKNRFEAEMGTSIFQWFQSHKMNYAKKLIEQTDMRMEDIALLLGYLSSCNFSTAVRGAFGFSPRELRRQAQTWSEAFNSVSAKPSARCPQDSTIVFVQQQTLELT